jgi:uncharacterized SAM-binding protein YcdF (DUF218 family)
LLNAAAARLTAPVSMLRRNPNLHMVYTGGEGELLGSGPSEAERARIFFDSQDVPPARVMYESKSHNTHDNAVMTAQLPGLNPAQHWLLVTSAWHMPRAMATFSKAGWNVTAYPVDFYSAPATPWSAYTFQESLDHWHMALHELLGIAAYPLAGWI